MTEQTTLKEKHPYRAAMDDYYNKYIRNKMKVKGSNIIRGRAEDAGYDLISSNSVVIRPGETKKISISTSVAIPNGYFGLICDRSSMGSKGIKVMGGVIDSSYRGEILVCLCNTNQGGDDESYQISYGDKIAQLILMPYIKPELEFVEELNKTERGSDGFGSTGK